MELLGATARLFNWKAVGLLRRVWKLSSVAMHKKLTLENEKIGWLPVRKASETRGFGSLRLCVKPAGDSPSAFSASLLSLRLCEKLPLPSVQSSLNFRI